ncbi:MULTISPECIES: hypothetical protein [unclassified Mycobacterium]|uniref:hypothetical protein n=1 Tax=unclassified Mycobacterium TaxID=2642494 RepID=UPI00048D2D40|nr:MULTISPECIES: hypothetical protein [unclassified Mycobacterium]SEB16731.1 hypothetical protein SAMN04488580_1096 [Mycobacterium sp. 283mftsu]
MYGEGPRWHDGRLWFSDVPAGRVYSAGETGDLTVALYLIVDDTTHDGLVRGESAGRVLQTRVDVPAAPT